MSKETKLSELDTTRKIAASAKTLYDWVMAQPENTSRIEIDAGRYKFGIERMVAPV